MKRWNTSAALIVGKISVTRLVSYTSSHAYARSRPRVGGAVAPASTGTASFGATPQARGTAGDTSAGPAPCRAGKSVRSGVGNLPPRSRAAARRRVQRAVCPDQDRSSHYGLGFVTRRRAGGAVTVWHRVVPHPVDPALFAIPMSRIGRTMLRQTFPKVPGSKALTEANSLQSYRDAGIRAQGRREKTGSPGKPPIPLFWAAGFPGLAPRSATLDSFCSDGADRTHPCGGRAICNWDNSDPSCRARLRPATES
jgi:hypothetical protein